MEYGERAPSGGPAGERFYFSQVVCEDRSSVSLRAEGRGRQELLGVSGEERPGLQLARAWLVVLQGVQACSLPSASAGTRDCAFSSSVPGAHRCWPWAQG